MERANNRKENLPRPRLHRVPGRKARLAGEPARDRLVDGFLAAADAGLEIGRAFNRTLAATCTRCRRDPRRSPSQRWCRGCAAAWQRRNRPAYAELGAAEQAKQRARARARAALRDGRLQWQPCEVCRTEYWIEKHHTDYRRPLAVRFLCRRCHRAEHRAASSP